MAQKSRNCKIVASYALYGDFCKFFPALPGAARWRSRLFMAGKKSQRDVSSFGFKKKRAASIVSFAYIGFGMLQAYVFEVLGRGVGDHWLFDRLVWLLAVFVVGHACFLTLSGFVCHILVKADLVFFRIHGANRCVWLGAFVVSLWFSGL